MIPVNTFAIPYLVGLITTASLALIFFIMYMKLGRRNVDLRLAIFLVFTASHAVMVFLIANVVTVGTTVSSEISDGSERTLMLLRFCYVLGTLGSICSMHFALEYCGKDNFVHRRIVWIYAIGLLFLPTIWTPWMLRARIEPLAQTSSWSCQVPWMPIPGPLALVYTLALTGMMVYSVLLLCRYYRQVKALLPSPIIRTDLLIMGFAVTLVGVLVDTLGGGIVWDSSVAVTPLAATGMGVLLAIALVQERVHAEREKEQIDREMKLASQIQRDLLPKKQPQLAGFDLAGWSQAASQTGGDSYDFMILPDKRVMVALGDATGHGMGPALLIAETRAMLRALTLTRQDPGVILKTAAELLAEYLPLNHFVTYFLGLLELSSSVLTYASAGHGPIIFYNCSENNLERQRATGLPLPLSISMSDGSAPKVMRRRLAPGDFVAIVSDGLFEVANPAGQQMGIDRLVQAIYGARHRSANELIKAVRRETEQFFEGAQQQDDMTMVVLRKT